MLKYFQKLESIIEYLFGNSSNEKKFLKENIKNKKVVLVDIGANVGTYMDLIKNNFKIKKIFSFEPSFDAYKILTRNYNSKLIRIENLAVSNTNNKKKFYQYKLLSQSGFYKIKKKKGHFGDIKSTYKINTVKLDNYFKKFKDKIDICKIDIQGEELNVLMGMKKLLKKKQIDYLKIEITFSSDYEKKQCDFEDIILFLKKFNYRLISISKTKFLKNKLLFIDGYFTSNFK